MDLRCWRCAWLLLVTGCAKTETPGATKPANPDLILATTTSTQDSGLLDALLPVFGKKTGYKVKTVAVGTYRRWHLAKRAKRMLFGACADGGKESGRRRQCDRAYMHNDFILLGAAEDIAKVKGSKIDAALKAIAERKRRSFRAAMIPARIKWNRLFGKKSRNQRERECLVSGREPAWDRP